MDSGKSWVSLRMSKNGPVGICKVLLDVWTLAPQIFTYILR